MITTDPIGGIPPDASVATDQGKRFLDEYQAYYSRLREADAEEWAIIGQERREFDGTLMDGLWDE